MVRHSPFSVTRDGASYPGVFARVTDFGIQGGAVYAQGTSVIQRADGQEGI